MKPIREFVASALVGGLLIITGMGEENVWKPALAEIEEALVPAFIIEELDDDRFTVFVPSVPTPLSGAIYILSAERVHPVNVPFTQTFKAVSRWGAGTKDLVAAMEPDKAAERTPLAGPEVALASPAGGEV